VVKVLTGVFDPPPSSPAVPWAYLATVLVLAVVAAVVVTEGALRASRRRVAETIRDR